MTKSNLVKLNDLLSFIGLLALISTGALVKFSLPPRSGGASIWGLTRHDWGDIHFYISVIFLILMSLHLFLHINFIKKAIRGKASREHNYRLSLGMAGFLVLVLLFMAPVFSPVENEGSREERRYDNRR